ncbi:hypothetical protein ABZ397_02995 [Streptomyces sp. NPDC005876]|uniref:hypothetical protein n=1 Tax=Streptomyces sp. NPDC005876 TaxID=3157076 RepID=UPI003403CBBF
MTRASRSGLRGLAAAGAVLCLTAGPQRAATAGPADTPAGYAFAADARRIDGAADAADAEPLKTGATYRSSLPRDGTLYYRLDLDAVSTAYVSVTAVPRPGGEVTAADGIRVFLRDADGGSCDSGTANFGAARSPRPVTAWGEREASPGATRCQDAGAYYLVVQRSRPQDSPPDAWDLELATASEPGLARTAARNTPGTWDSATPGPPAGTPVRRRGGDGFAKAAPVGEGAWRDDIRPGQTLFYKVPLDWGRRVYATAELAAGEEGGGYATAALQLALHNPVRGRVDSAAAGYSGRRTAADLGPVPPVAYDNRYAVAGRVSAMRFAGSYYLVVHLAQQVADDFGDGPFGLTLRVRLLGTAGAGPGYAGEPVPRGLFSVAGRDREAAAGPGEGGSGDLAMTAVAVGGIGTGSLLLAGLGVWTAVARRRGA